VVLIWILHVPHFTASEARFTYAGDKPAMFIRVDDEVDCISDFQIEVGIAE
jgi:hypothetical protein